MPPKKEKRETKAKSAKTKQRSKLVDEVATGEMSKEQLEEDIVRLQEDIVRIHEELDQERKERNYFQMEQEKTRSFWEITRRQLDEKNSELRYKEREMKEAEELHQVEIRGLWSSTQIEVIKTMLNTPDSEICSVSFSNPALYITASSVFHAQPVLNVETELVKELDIASKLMVFLFSFFTGLAFASMIYLGYIALVDHMRSAPVVCLPSADASPQNT